MAPPQEEGRTANAARLGTDDAMTLAQQLKGINNLPEKTWSTEGWRLMAVYLQSTDPKDVEALNCHVTGIRQRLQEALKV